MIASETFPASAPISWRELVLPKEHGSWSLAFEPIALGLLCAPSVGGACLAAAAAAAFFCRRPLRTALRDNRPERRRVARGALIRCASMAAIAAGGAAAIGGLPWLAWLVPSAILGAVFLSYDVRSDGREEAAEVAGAAAFAFLPPAFAGLAGWSPTGAIALGLVMASRAVPTVIFVRAAVRGRKIGRFDFTRSFLAAVLALVLTAGLATAGYAPLMSAVCCGLFVARIAWVRYGPEIRPKKLGMIEAMSGIAFVLIMATAWRA